MSKKVKNIKKLELSEEEIDSVSDESEEDEETKRINKKMAKYVTVWVDCDDKIKEIQSLIKNLKLQKKTQEKYILDIMKNYEGENTIKISDGKLTKNVSKTKGTLKPEIVETALTEFMKNPVKAKQLTEFIMDKRVTKEREYLKRIKNRVNK